jgi:DNA-binding protein HU-beta
LQQDRIDRHIAKNADISKAAATYALESTINAVNYAQKAMRCLAFGTFAVGKRAARTGRNPRTGEAIKIKAAGSSFVQAKPERRFELTDC